MRRSLVLGCVIALVVAGCGWARPRFDAANTGYNSFEHKISAANVATLTKQFTTAPTGAAASPGFVVARGHLFVEGSPVRAYDATGVVGCRGTPRVCSPQWTLTENGSPDVIGSALYLGPRGFDADGIRGCTGNPKVCSRVFSEAVGSAPLGPTDPNRLHFDLFRNLLPHGGEFAALDADDAPCEPAPADCPLRWSNSFGGGASGGVLGGPAITPSSVFATYSPVGGTGALYAFHGEVSGGQPRWVAPLEASSGSAVVVGAGVVVVQLHGPSISALEAFDAAGVKGCSGVPKVCTPLWRTDGQSGRSDIAAPAIANGVVYRAGGGALGAYAANGAGCSGTPKVCRPLWRAIVGAEMTAPVVANGLVFVGRVTDGTVTAYDANGVANCRSDTHECRALWTTTVAGQVRLIEVADGRLYVGNDHDTVTVFALP